MLDGLQINLSYSRECRILVFRSNIESCQRDPYRIQIWKTEQLLSLITNRDLFYSLGGRD